MRACPKVRLVRKRYAGSTNTLLTLDTYNQMRRASELPSFFLLQGYVPLMLRLLDWRLMRYLCMYFSYDLMQLFLRGVLTLGAQQGLRIGQGSTGENRQRV